VERVAAGAAATAPADRLQAALLLELLPGPGAGPALRRLVADPEPAVAVAALPGLGAHLSNPELGWEEREATALALTALLTDPREEVVLGALHQAALLLPAWPGEGRDQLLTIPLASAPALWRAAPRPAALHGALLAALASVPALGASEAVLSGFVLPGLAALLEQAQGGPGEEAVQLLMAEVEGSRRPAGGDRRDSALSAHSLGEEPGREGREGRVRATVGKLLPKPGGLSPFWTKK
jgi:hypothetical protein